MDLVKNAYWDFHVCRHMLSAYITYAIIETKYFVVPCSMKKGVPQPWRSRPQWRRPKRDLTSMRKLVFSVGMMVFPILFLILVWHSDMVMQETLWYGHIPSVFLVAGPDQIRLALRDQHPCAKSSSLDGCSMCLADSSFSLYLHGGVHRVCWTRIFACYSWREKAN